jgi:hypothetical protein
MKLLTLRDQNKSPPSLTNSCYIINLLISLDCLLGTESEDKMLNKHINAHKTIAGIQDLVW